MTRKTGHSRRQFLTLALGALVPGVFASAVLGPAGSALAAARRIRWSELIPEGVEYGEMIANGVMDNVRDVWIPEFDENGNALNMALDGQEITLAGYVIPLEFTSSGVTDFVLVPFVGACIHVPPPPPNQLIFVTAESPWPNGNLWDAVLVTGTLRASLKSTEVANVGYEITGARVETYRKE